MQAKYLFLTLGMTIGAMVGALAANSLTRSTAVVRAPVPGVPAAALTPTQHLPAQVGLAEIVGLHSYVRQRASVYNLAMRADEAALVDLIEQVEDLAPRDGEWILPILYGRYGEVDGAAALAHLGSRGYGPLQNQRELTSLFMAWLRVDEDAALERLTSLGPQERLQIGAWIMRSGSQRSEAQQRALAERLGMGRYMNQFSLADRVRLSDDPEAQLEKILAGGDYRTRQMSLAALMSQWAKADPQAAMAAAARVPNLELRHQLHQQVIGQWAQDDPAEVFEWAIAQPRSAGRTQYWQQALQSLATRDPRRAMDLVDQLDAVDRDAAMAGVLTMWGMVEPRGAAQWLDAVSDPSTRAQVVGQIAQGYAQQYPHEALQWLASLSAEARAQAARGMVHALVEFDPRTAISVLDLIDDPRQAANAARGLAVNWARRDPEAAVAWISENIGPDQRPEVLAGALQQWAQYDVEAALRHAQALDDLPERERSVVALLPFLRSDPARAEAHYETLTLAESRQQAAQVLYRSWYRTDPERAEVYRVIAGIDERLESPQMIMGGMGRTQAIPMMRNPSMKLIR